MGHQEDIAVALNSIAKSFKALGTNDANTDMGAIEMLSESVANHGREIHDGLIAVANSIEILARAIQDRQ